MSNLKTYRSTILLYYKQEIVQSCHLFIPSNGITILYCSVVLAVFSEKIGNNATSGLLSTGSNFSLKVVLQ